MSTMSVSQRWHPEQIRTSLRGVLAFPITPYSDDGEVDLDAVRANASFLTTSAIVAPSGTGEFFALTPDEAIAVVEATVEAAGDKPVVAAAGFGSRVGADLARRSEAAGAAAIMIVPP